jgi:hypothetical protein
MRSSAFGRSIILALIFITIQCTFESSAFAAGAKSKATRRYLFDFGLGYFSNLNSRSMATVIGGGLAWNIDPQLDVIVAADLGFSFEHNDVRFLFPQIKTRYMFDPEANSSWYAGAGLGMGYGANHEGGGRNSDSVTGMGFSAAIGLKAYQKSSASVFVELEHSMIMREANYGTPIMTAIKVGIILP